MCCVSRGFGVMEFFAPVEIFVPHIGGPLSFTGPVVTLLLYMGLNFTHLPSSISTLMIPVKEVSIFISEPQL